MRAAREGARIVGDMLRVSGGRLLYVTSATLFREGEGFRKQAVERLDAAEVLGYEALKGVHLKDFWPIMATCFLRLEEDDALAVQPRDQRLHGEQGGEYDLSLAGASLPSAAICWPRPSCP